MLKRIQILLLIVACSGAFSGPAKADCISEAVSCVVDVAKAQYYAVSSLGPVLAFTAQHPFCVQAIVGQDYASLTIMGVITGAAAGGLIGASEGGCHNDLYGKYAPALAQGLSFIPVPGLKDIAAGSVAPQAVAEILNAVTVPGVTTPQLLSLKDQLDCGCAVAATGADAVERIKLAIMATGAAAEQCAGALSCLGGPVLDAIGTAGKTMGKAFYESGKCAIGPNDCGEKEPMTEDAYYALYWEPFVPQFVDAWITGSGFRPDDSPYSYQLPNISKDEKLSKVWHECEDYYLNHRYSGGALSTDDHAQRACDNMRDNRFTPAANKLYGDRMDNELFPKKMSSLIRKPQTKYQAPCAIPKEPVKPSSGGGVDVSGSNSGADTFGGKQLEFSEECKREINFKLGLSADGAVVGQPDTVIGDVKNSYKTNNFDLSATLDKLLVDGSKYDLALKKIGELKKTQINVSGQLNEKTVLINKAYEKFATAKWNEYRAKCPVKNANSYSLDSVTRSICIPDTANFLGIALAYQSDAQPQDDLGSLNFSSWKTTPKIYQLALESFSKQGDAATQELADSRVQTAFAFNKSQLDGILEQSVTKAKVVLANMRQKQEQAYQTKLDQYTNEYTNELTCPLTATEAAQQLTCKYSKDTLEALFAQWQKGYKQITAKKIALDIAVGKGIPYSELAGSDFNTLLALISGSASLNKPIYKTIKNKPGAVIKEKKQFSDGMSNTVKRNSLGMNVNDMNKDKKASKSGTDPFGNPVSSGNGPYQGKLDTGSLQGPAAQGQRQQRIGMPGAPTMQRLQTNKLPQTATSLSDQTPVTSLVDGQKALDQQAGKVLAEVDQQQGLRGMRSVQGLTPASPGIQGPSNNGLADRIPDQGLKNNLPTGESSIGAVAGLAGQSKAGVANPSTSAIPDPSRNGNMQATVPISNQPPMNDLSRINGLATPANNTGRNVRDNAAGSPPASSPAPYVKSLGDKPTSDLTQNKPPEPPFDRARYQHMARQALETKWYGQCKKDPCRSQISALIDTRIREVLMLLDSGQDLRIKPVLDKVEGQMDMKYNPQMQDKVAQSQLVDIHKVEPVNVDSSTPVSMPKGNKIKTIGVP